MTRDEEGDRLLVSSGGITHVHDLLSTLSEETLRGENYAEVDHFYVAPEILTGQPADVRSDVYTIGVLLYEMATGARPFSGNNLPELVGHILQVQPPDPRASSAEPARICRRHHPALPRRQPVCALRIGGRTARALE